MRGRIIHGIAGALVLIGLVLGYTVHEYWFFLIAFVGVNLFQNSITQWCLLGDILKSLGVEE
ncbi:MAG: DUF2892 domain-containing protein [Reichenbachiella sp.]